MNVFSPNIQSESANIEPVCEANKPIQHQDNKKRMKRGCMIGGIIVAIVTILLLAFFLLVGIMLTYDSPGNSITKEESRFSTTEEVQKLSKLNFLSDLQFVEAKSNGYYNNSYYKQFITFKWEQPLSEKQKKQLLNAAQKHQQDHWEYGDELNYDNLLCIQRGTQYSSLCR